MIPCPSCQQPVEILDKHLGTLFTCPHCNAVYFIDWNGQPEMAQHEPEPEAPVDAPVEAFMPGPEDFSGGMDFQGGESFQPGNDFQPPIQDFSTPENSEQAYATEAYEPNQEPVSENVSYAEAPEPSMGEVPSVEETPYDFSQPLDAINEPEIGSGVSDSADFSDVTGFANADTAVGPMAYTVTIEGIESSMLLNQLREAMTDSRFGWDVTEILKQVGGGRLVLRSLSPAKASVLINRIKYLPFKISWRQDVLSGA